MGATDSKIQQIWKNNKNIPTGVQRTHSIQRVKVNDREAKEKMELCTLKLKENLIRKFHM